MATGWSSTIWPPVTRHGELLRAGAGAGRRVPELRRQEEASRRSRAGPVSPLYSRTVKTGKPAGRRLIHVDVEMKTIWTKHLVRCPRRAGRSAMCLTRKKARYRADMGG